LFIFNAQTESSNVSYFFDDLDSNHQDISVLSHGNPIYNKANDIYYIFKDHPADARELCPVLSELRVCIYTYFKVNFPKMNYIDTMNPPRLQASKHYT
jgi:hypothetical protein